MTSSRLPGKILSELAGRPMLAQQLRRLRRCKRLDELCIATTVNAADDPVVELARAEGVAWFRGSESDVLGRYLGAARQTRAELVVRVTSDCPLIDAETLDAVVALALDAPCDYASNTMQRTFPRGLDAEALFADVLERLGRLATSTPAREHVTWFLHRERPELFVTRQLVDTEDHSDLRWTVDTADDLALVRAIYAHAGLGDRDVPYRELVRLVRAEPELVAMNAHVAQRNQ
jgi:spore coat polysaccharide biosynthesis protein SpsF